MEKKYYCKKRYISIDLDFEICKDCCRRKLSGFEDVRMCEEFNLMFVDDNEEKNEVII
jgi:hypothetical protein